MTTIAVKGGISPICLIFVAAVSAALPVPAEAEGNIEDGKVRAAACAGCHGLTGVSNNPMWPNLAGQQKDYLASQLRAFRDGTRNNPVMEPMARGLSDEDIENLAAYYASRKP